MYARPTHLGERKFTKLPILPPPEAPLRASTLAIVLWAIAVLLVLALAAVIAL